MKSIGVKEAATQLSNLLRRVALGEEITITRRGVLVARLIPPADCKRSRQLGVFAGQVKMTANFDGPLPNELLDAFEGRKPRRK